METALHRQLKAQYADSVDACEVAVDGYRIDALRDGWLVEIQQASLGAIRKKLQTLCQSHRVHVVKPLPVRKYIIRKSSPHGTILGQRWSPHRGSVLDAFFDLVHLRDAFPHTNLRIELLPVTIEEVRTPLRRHGKFRVFSRALLEHGESHVLSTNEDLWALLPNNANWRHDFTTKEIAAACAVPDWHAQKIAYCLRQAGAAEVLGKRERRVQYRAIPPKTKRRRRAA